MSDYLKSISYAPGEFERLQEEYDILLQNISKLLEGSISDKVKEKYRVEIREMFPGILEERTEELLKEEISAMTLIHTAGVLADWFEILHEE